jgi:predicted nucleic acid-binding protein
MVLIDTDILIWILRDREDIVASFKSTVEAARGFLYITPVQVAEIFTGMRENEELSTKEFLESFILISLDYNIGETAGLYMNQFGKSHGLTLADALIASAARKNALKLWTLNRKHYPMLEADDFWKPGR